MENRPKILAFYLPQYYPFKENNEWWGEGFTEWTSVGRAKPLFKGHYQPKVPKDLSYYDLRVPETRQKQADLAKEYGVDGFCFWHYWFGNGKRLLEIVEDEITATGKPEFPYCYCWANHTWYSKNWNRKDTKFGHQVLIEQTYPGVKDYIAHFNCCLPAFKNPYYVKEGNKPVFCIYDAAAIPNIQLFFNTWNKLAVENGFDGIHFISYSMNLASYDKVKDLSFDDFVVDVMNKAEKTKSSLYKKIREYAMKLMVDNWLPLRLVDYKSYIRVVEEYYTEHDNIIPCVLPNYDHSPRSGKNGLIITNSTPENFGICLEKIKQILIKRQSCNKYLFLKAWNEWGEGNYLEPDLKYGRGYLEQIKKVFE